MSKYYVMVSLYTKAFVEVYAPNAKEAADFAKQTATLNNFDIDEATKSIDVEQVYLEEADGLWAECEKF